MAALPEENSEHLTKVEDSNITIITITIVIILSSSLLGPPAPRHGGPELVVVVQHLLPLRGGEAPRVGGAAPLLGRWGGQRHGDRSED